MRASDYILMGGILVACALVLWLIWAIYKLIRIHQDVLDAVYLCEGGIQSIKEHVHNIDIDMYAISQQNGLRTNGNR